jgi:hypothetical protein
MLPFLSPNLKVFGLKLWHCALTRKTLKTILKKLGNLKGKNLGQRLYTNNLKIHNVTKAF